ncbi:centrosome-associated zinc finger protein CP190 isoform X2 [Leptidea sinapis]|uniref:centrosome-associated zinc finger protein CP190 isoform X2 n=1 Tax=Leptidea sinapis TaxID=189913 RepID=UPI0021252826|nr:centrosome-associated zinc finger protein CP190 isoform X2 [Leptidea sinapis]
MSELKQVKVDNWGIYFLQKLKHFFNRTDYCDLTLQFQDNAQLKVHRLVLNACTEYFEILERTCEMYEDCLIMPDDLQADVVVPIVNFMYTGQLEFKMDLLEKLYQTSVVMNIPVLTKLLDSHRVKNLPLRTNPIAKRYSRTPNTKKKPIMTSPKTLPINLPKKRNYQTAFEDINFSSKDKSTIADLVVANGFLHDEIAKQTTKLKPVIKDPKPTRYELPMELDGDGIFENSFTSISYGSKPLMVHPSSTKQYASNKSRLFDEPSSSKTFLSGNSTIDIVECRKITESEEYENDSSETILGDSYEAHSLKKEKNKDSSQLFDQILINDSPRVEIEAKDRKQIGNLDHAKIISEVLKRYPHLVKSNKNIKLKILNTHNKPKKLVKPKIEVPDFTYESDVVDSKEAARLIALGAENVKGPWICLICGTPGRALHFTTYYKYRRHLVDVHREKPVSTMCEYCGLKSTKHNYLLHHMYTKHGIEPPPVYKFPKCNVCDYVALTENLLVKHKLSHTENRKFRCTICSATFRSTNLLMSHIQKTGHKYSLGSKVVPQCVYCSKKFTRDSNLYSHLKTFHYKNARSDGIIEESDEERQLGEIGKEEEPKYIEVELPAYDTQSEEMYGKELKPEQGNIEIVMTKKSITTQKSKILNSSFSKLPSVNKGSAGVQNVLNKNEYIQTHTPKKKQEIVVIDNNEYILQDFQLIPKQEHTNVSFLSDNYQTETDERMDLARQSTSDYSEIYETKTADAEMLLKSQTNVNEPIQIVVSNEEEYNALLSSNHSIIFDNTNANKSLTVLTAPSTTIANPNMAINNASSNNNNMMLIQEDYTLNTTNTNLSDNPNIVVVYGHATEGNSNQYQLIATSQGIDTQYIQSTAILTKNLETISTSIASAHDISHIGAITTNATWQNNIQDTEIIPIPMSEQVQHSEDANEDEEQHNLIQLPEVNMHVTQEIQQENISSLPLQTEMSHVDIIENTNSQNQL